MSVEALDPLLIVISGPSGVGKDSALHGMKLLQRPWRYITTATTRPKRPGERHDVDYIFMSTEEFRTLMMKDGFLECAEVYGTWYGVPRAQADEAMASGKDVIVKTDIQGARTLRSKIPDALLIFLAPPTMEELKHRLLERKSETEEALRRRIETAKTEMKCQDEFDYVVVNHNGRVDEAVEEIDRIILGEKTKRRNEALK